MVHYEVFSNCVKTRYKTSICSNATFVLSLITLFTFVLPFLFAYRSQGLWLKNNVYREQPDVHFKYDYLLLLETGTLVSPVICTTFPSVASVVAKYNNCPVIKVQEEDFNKDGLKDVLHFEIDALLPSTETVFSVSLILLFDYKLYSHSWLEMESVGYFETGSALGGSRVDVVADLRLQQKEPLRDHGRDTRYNTSVLPDEHFTLSAMLNNYASRNVSTRLENVYAVWTRGQAHDEPFVVSATVHYPEESVTYRPGFWEVVKTAWLQYLSLLIPAVLVSRQLKEFIVANYLVHTITVPPWKKIN